MKRKGRDLILTFLIFFFLLTAFSLERVQAAEFGFRQLRDGDRGTDVGILQLKLQWLGLYEDNIDGIFGSITQSAVREFQRQKGLNPDGIVGPKTYSQLPELEELLKDLDQQQVVYLAQTITGEARGENFKGQVAVGAVVINRKNDLRFPDNIRDIVLEEGQFTSVQDGQINIYYTDSALKAAQLALLGYDPTNGALFFYNPSIATELRWITTREVLARIGKHIFAY